MLINCPRCGFSQPIDKYCAQCGVDMETFKPAEPSFFKKTFGSTVFQVTVLFLLTFGAAFFLYQKKSQNILARVNYLKGSFQVNSTENQPSNKAVDVESPNEDQSDEAASSTTEGTRSIVATANPGVTAVQGTAPSKDSVLRITYAEVSKALLQTIFEDSQGTGQFMSFKDYSAGIIPNLDKKFLSNPAVKILHRDESPLTIGKNMQWFYGLKDRLYPDLEIGMTTFIELGEVDGGNYRGNLEIQRSWREGPGPTGIQRRSFPAIFEIGATAGFFISSVMPHRSNLENDDELVNIDVYKILKSEEFQRSDSDFVIFVELSRAQ